MSYQSQPFFLKSGENVGLITHFGNGEDQGAQWLMASPQTDLGWFPQSGNASFETSNFRKNALYSGDTGFSYYSYSCVVTNVGDIATSFILEGGGNI